MSELKPCPFCGGTDVAVYLEHNQFKTTTWNFVKCQNFDCQAEGPIDLGLSGSEEKWNTRAACAEPTPQAEEAHT